MRAILDDEVIVADRLEPLRDVLGEAAAGGGHAFVPSDREAHRRDRVVAKRLGPADGPPPEMVIG